LSRLYGYTNQVSYHEQAEQTMEVLAGVAGQYGLFAATYGIAAVHFSLPHVQIVIVGEEHEADQLKSAAGESFALNKAVIKLQRSTAVAANLPAALAETIPHMPLGTAKATALVCTGFSCLPPISDAEELRTVAQKQSRGPE
jgi:uncharacterized protein